jgi:hypothetical protein
MTDRACKVVVGVSLVDENGREIEYKPAGAAVMTCSQYILATEFAAKLQAYGIRKAKRIESFYAEVPVDLGGTTVATHDLGKRKPR